MQPKLYKALAISAVWLLTSSLGAQEMPPPQVEFVTVQAMSLSPSIQLKGNVIALQDAVISSEVEGVLEDIQFVGNKVELHQSIGQINQDKLQWQVQREDAKLKGLLAELKFLESEVERFKKLASNDNASKTQLQRELATQDMVAQQILSARADLAEAKRALDMSSIKAPFDGIVARRHAQVGEFIRIGDPIVRLVNQNLKDISVPTPIRHQQLLKVGMLVKVNYHDQLLEFPIRQVVRIGDQNSRMVEVRLDITGSDLIIGDSVTVFIPKAEPNVEVAIPRDALVIRNSQSFVYTIDANSKAQQVVAQINYADGPWIVLHGGVNAGDRVIVRGAERLQPDNKVTATKSIR